MATQESHEGPPVDFMDSYGDFVLNVRVVGAIGAFYKEGWEGF